MQEFYWPSFCNSASGNSFWRGYWYCKNGNVISHEKISDTEYRGKVRNDSGNVYDVTINLKKPRASKCNCPFAAGKYKVCKHMVALYFAVFPDEIVRFDEGRKAYEEEQKRRIIEEERKLEKLRKELKKRYPNGQKKNWLIMW